MYTDVKKGSKKKCSPREQYKKNVQKARTKRVEVSDPGGLVWLVLWLGLVLCSHTESSVGHSYNHSCDHSCKYP